MMYLASDMLRWRRVKCRASHADRNYITCVLITYSNVTWDNDAQAHGPTPAPYQS